MLTAIQALLMGLLQGVAELFPISSLGHSVILPALIGWHINEQDPAFLTFLVATHTATALVLFIFFFGDWIKVLGGLWRVATRLRIPDSDTYARLGTLLVVATVPAGIVGLVFEKPIRTIFIAPISAAFFLLLNGGLLYLAEQLRKKAPPITQGSSDERITHLTFGRGIVVGTMQILALIPGFSRTGASLAGGLMMGLSHEDAVRFSFLLATPIIGAAAALKLPALIHAPHAVLVPTLIGAAAAACGAFIATTFLVNYFKTEHRLTPFAIYCVLAGTLSLALLIF